MPRAGLTPAIVTRAAADLADERGLDHVAPSSVAQTLGVRTPSLYGHVGGAADLLQRITLLALAELADAAAHAVGERSGSSAIRAYAHCLRDYARTHPGRWEAAQRPLDHEAAMASAGPRHTALLVAAFDAFDLPATERPHAVRAVGSALHGFIQQEAAGAFSHSDPAPDASWERLLDALEAMLAAWPSPHQGPRRSGQ